MSRATVTKAVRLTSRGRNGVSCGFVPLHEGELPPGGSVLLDRPAMPPTAARRRGTDRARRPTAGALGHGRAGRPGGHRQRQQAQAADHVHHQHDEVPGRRRDARGRPGRSPTPSRWRSRRSPRIAAITTSVPNSRTRSIGRRSRLPTTPPRSRRWAPPGAGGPRPRTRRRRPGRRRPRCGLRLVRPRTRCACPQPGGVIGEVVGPARVGAGADGPEAPVRRVSPDHRRSSHTDRCTVRRVSPRRCRPLVLDCPKTTGVRGRQVPEGDR